jgi:hypothetical protein
MFRFEEAGPSARASFIWVVRVTRGLLLALRCWVWLGPRWCGQSYVDSAGQAEELRAAATYIHSSIGGRPEGFATRGDSRSHNSSAISYRRAMTALSWTV